jgi:hypothetical protein
MNGFFLPLAFFLLSDKTMESYNLVFDMLAGFGLNPKSIGCDFEAGIIGLLYIQKIYSYETVKNLINFFQFNLSFSLTL